MLVRLLLLQKGMLRKRQKLLEKTMRPRGLLMKLRLMLCVMKPL